MINQNASAVGKLLSALLMYLSLSIGQASAQELTQTPITKDINYAIGGYYECLPTDYKTATTKKYPLLIFIHGIGELGNGSATELPRILRHGLPKVIDRGLFPASFTVNGQTSSFIVISPQFRANYRDAAVVTSLIDYCVATYRVDPSCIYLSGLSMGGGISWVYAGKSAENAKRIAGMLVVCGNTNVSSGGVANIVGANLPVWITHNDGDPVVSVNNSINWEKGLNGHSPAITPKTLLNIFSSDGHDAWSKTYDPAFKPNGQNVYQWLLSHKRGTTTGTTPPVNKVPVVNAGPDVTLMVPEDMVMLDGTATDADGSIVSNEWTKVSGPAEGEITRPENSLTMAIGLVEGSYTFRLTAKDNDGATGTDDVKIIVKAQINRAPVANAGDDITLTLPLNTAQVTGEGTDADGYISSYNWTKVSGPAGSSIDHADASEILITDLTAGTYVFRLLVKDNDGASATDDITIVVGAAQPAVVKAGNDTLVYKNQSRPDTVVLDGLASVGGAKYVWTKASGPGTTKITDPEALVTYAIGLQEGTHVFKLTIDGKESDQVKVVVRDWQKKNVSPCRPGGGKSFIVPESYPGQYNHLYINRDNRLGEPVMGGDTLYFKGGKITAFEIGDFGGGPGCPVYVMPKDDALVITDGYFRIGVKDSNVVQHVVLDGTVLRGKGIPYGFFIDNRTTPEAENNYSGLVATWVSNFTVKGYRSIKTGIMQIKIDAKEAPYGRYDKFIQKRIKIQDNFIDGSTAEGMYIGHTASNGGQLDNAYGPPPRMDSVEISDNIITNCAWDGIQLANARTAAVIRHNLIYKTGLLNQASQRAGILLGANTTGLIDSNIVINSKGNGIQVFGYGAVKVHRNIIDSIYGGSGDQDGIYQSHLAVVPESFNISLSVNNFGNLISRVERKSIRIANNSGAMIPGHTYSNTFIDPVETNAANLITANAGDNVENNQVISSFPFHINTLGTKSGAALISMTQGDDTETFTTVKEVVDWLFGRLGGLSASNEPPVANAGTDKVITLPLDSVLVNGSGADVDGSIAAYQWNQLSGSSDAVIRTASAARTGIAKLTAGVYTFELTVTDNGKAKDKDTITITVKPAPAPIENSRPDVFAGNNIRITLPVNTVTLKGKATDEDGTIAAVKWTKIGGPDGGRLTDETELLTRAEALTEGIYLFQLQATDNQNATEWDTVKVTVAPAAVVTPANVDPAAYAGADQIIQLPKSSITLEGNGTDTDGTIESYRWQKISGPTAGKIKNVNAAITAVNSLTKGNYLFELTVADNMGAFKTDTVQVTVLDKKNEGPIADAGADRSIQLPVNSFILNGKGTDEDGSIETYEWQKLSGPAIPNFNGATTSQSQLRNLKAGTYVFELEVTDNDGASATDVMQLVVNAAAVVPNKAPVAYAGSDLTVQLPQNTAVLSGSGLDEDGVIKAYQWRQVSGPATATIGTPKDAQAEVEDFVQGSYQFEIKVTDDAGAVDADTVSVLVKPAPAVVPNKAPVVDAGADITLTLPVTATLLTGTATDADGMIVSYRWKKIAGSSDYAITTPQSAQTEIRNLTTGVYDFELKATDDEGAVSSDTIRITVQAVAARPMFVLTAGDDKVITLPTDSIALEGVADDPYNSITSYSWTKVSGPAAGAFENSTAAQTLVKGLVEGVYVFACEATDANGNKLSDTVQVSVKTLVKSVASVYPNPSNGLVTVKIESNTRAMNTRIAVYDVMGRLMHMEEFMRTGGTTIKQLDLTKVPAGIYTLMVVTDINTKTSMKLVKQ